MKDLLGLITGVTLTVAASVSQATVIATQSAEGVLFSEQAGVTTVDFETGCTGYTSCTGDFEIRHNLDGSVQQSAAPYAATPIGGHCLTVPNPVSNGTASFKLANSYDYFGMFWGSIDSYNTLSFLLDGVEVESFGGDDLTPLLANGNQAAWTSNRFINFSFSDGDKYDEVVLTSTSFAFETDNHAFGMLTTTVTSVSEPGTLALFGLGLAGLGFARRQSKK